MRTKTLLSAVAVLAASLAVSKAQVYSQNVVGYVNTTCVGGGKYTCINNPLNGATNTLPVLFAAVPNSSQVLKYDPSISDYKTYGKVAGNWLNGGAAVTLVPGEGCLVFIPAASGDVSVTFVGEVLQGNLTNHFAGGYKLVGNMVPDSGTVTALGLAPANGSQLLQWIPANQDWTTHGRVAGNWLNGTPSLAVGEGFMLNSSGAYDWVRSFTVN